MYLEYDICSHDACVNPLDKLWSLHLSCHSPKCHMSFSFAFLSQCLFFCLLPTVILPFLSFPFNLSGVCIILFYYFVILTIPILCIYVSFCFCFCLSYTFPLPCLSMSLLSSWPEGPSISLWLFLTMECARLQIFMMLIGHTLSGYTGRHHSYI